MLGSLNSDVTLKYVVYALATRRSCANTSVCDHAWYRPTAAKTAASATSVTASARGSHTAYGARATIARSAAKGKTKKSNSIEPCWRSRAQRSDSEAQPMRAVAGTASQAGIGARISPCTTRYKSASDAAA